MKLITAFFLILFSQSLYAQSGGIETKYGCNEIYGAFSDQTTKKLYKEPVLWGTNVKVIYNASFESYTISYADKNGSPSVIYLTFVRYGKDSDWVIVKDGHGNPMSVLNEIVESGKLTLVSHDLTEGKYVFMLLALDLKRSE